MSSTFYNNLTTKKQKIIDKTIININANKINNNDSLIKTNKYQKRELITFTNQTIATKELKSKQKNNIKYKSIEPIIKINVNFFKIFNINF